MIIPDSIDTTICHATILPLLSFTTFSEAATFPENLFVIEKELTVNNFLLCGNKVGFFYFYY